MTMGSLKLWISITLVSRHGNSRANVRDDFTGVRSLYRHAELDRVLNPRSIAIVGASPKAGSFGDRVLANLTGFDGEVYLVNPKYEVLGERRCYASVADLPVVPDCVAVTVA